MSKRKTAREYDDERPAVDIEAVSLQASGNPNGGIDFQLNTTSVTTAVQAMMLAFPDDIFQSQEIKKDRTGVLALLKLLKRLRRLGFQVPAAPLALNNESLPAGSARPCVSTSMPNYRRANTKEALLRTRGAVGAVFAWRAGPRRPCWSTSIANAGWAVKISTWTISVASQSLRTVDADASSHQAIGILRLTSSRPPASLTVWGWR